MQYLGKLTRYRRKLISTKPLQAKNVTKSPEMRSINLLRFFLHSPQVVVASFTSCFSWVFSVCIFLSVPLKFWTSSLLRCDVRFACTLRTGIFLVNRPRKISVVSSRRLWITASMRFPCCQNIPSSSWLLVVLKLLLQFFDFVRFMTSFQITILNVLASTPAQVNRFWRMFKRF